MKISSINTFNFKGHAAGKIKALYMQNPGNQRQLTIFNKMLEIGEKEGFDVFMHNGEKLENKKLTTIQDKYNFWGVWAQDNKIITTEDNIPIMLTSEHQSKEEFLEAQLFAQKREIKGYSTELNFDGGDIFLGKKDNGDKYLITSRQTIYMNAVFQYLKKKNPQLANRETFVKLMQNGILQDGSGNILADIQECSKSATDWEKYAQEMMYEIFEIKPENLVILPETEFHLDLTIRPLDYPYVLVNDDNEVDKVIRKLEKRFKDDFAISFMIEEIKEQISRQRNKFATSDEACKTLEEKGFIPIKIAMMYGRGGINFANAIVHQNDDGLVYITNSTETESEFYNAFQEYFERDLLKKCPQIKRTYFISGNKIGKDLNDMMVYLKDFKGGIHCLCCEEMET